MATEDNGYFTDILDTLNEYQHRHGQGLSSKKFKEAVLRVKDEEEEEMKRNIRNDSAEQFDAIRNSKERVDGISNSNKQVDAKSEAKSYREYVFRTDFETKNVF